MSESMAINEAARAKRELYSLQRKYAKSQSKIAIQANEIVRLNKMVEVLQKEKKELLADLKKIRGDKNEN